MPYLAPVWISDVIRKVFPSRIRAWMDGVEIMTSNAATRPFLSMRFSSSCEMTQISVDASCVRI